MFIRTGNRESPLDSTFGAIFPENCFCFFVCIFCIFWTPVSQKLFEIPKCALEINYCTLKDLQIWYCKFFDIQNGYWGILKKKNCFGKNFVRGQGAQKHRDLGQNTFKISVLTGSRESPLDSKIRAIFLETYGWGCFFCDFSNPCISKTVGGIKMFRQVSYCILKDLQNWMRNFFRNLKRFLKYFEKKKYFWKKNVRGLGSHKRLDSGQNTFKIFDLIGNRESPLDGTVGVIFPQN